MTTEEKAKAYDEALEWMRKVYPTLTGADKEDAEYYFPELKESEDERIRKAIVALIEDIQQSDKNFAGVELSDMLAYLEKQKINTEGDFGRGYDCGYKACLNSHGAEFFERQKEQKPVEKENTLTDFEEVLNSFLFDFANSPIEDCEPKEYIKKHSAEILKAAYKELNAKLQQDIFEAKQEGRREGCEVAKAEQKPADLVEEAYIENRNDGTYTCATTNDGFDAYMDGFNKGYELGIKEQTKNQ